MGEVFLKSSNIMKLNPTKRRRKILNFKNCRFFENFIKFIVLPRSETKKLGKVFLKI